MFSMKLVNVVRWYKWKYVKLIGLNVTLKQTLKHQGVFSSYFSLFFLPFVFRLNQTVFLLSVSGLSSISERNSPLIIRYCLRVSKEILDKQNYIIIHWSMIRCMWLLLYSLCINVLRIKKYYFRMWIQRWRWNLLHTRINAFNLRSFSLDQCYNFETPRGDRINYAVVVYGVITSWQNSQARRSARLSYKPFVCSRHSTNWIQYNIKRREKKRTYSYTNALIIIILIWSCARRCRKIAVG